MVNGSVNKKYLGFEYLLFKFIEWYGNGRECERHDFTRIQALKLLFFAAAVKTSDGDDLLDEFDDFYAMQHGPVESEIYNAIAGNHLLNFQSLGNDLIKRCSAFSFDNLDKNFKDKIDASIIALKNENCELVFLSAFDLVDLSHKWNSWKRTFEMAQILGRRSEKIDIELIRKDTQYFI